MEKTTEVNFAKSEIYRKSTIPDLQRMLNDHEKEMKLITEPNVPLCTSELCHTSFCVSYH